MQKRWYDLDPTLSLAVSLMEKADEKVQLECAYHIIDKAKIACENSNIDLNGQFADVGKLIKHGKGGIRTIVDYKLSRYACYLITQNGDPRKDVIALAQTYFAIQTRKQELSEKEYSELTEDEKRFYQRNLTKKGNYSLNIAAKNAGVNNFDKFHNAGYKGLSNMRQALRISQNTIAVQVLDDLTPQKSIEYLRDLGVTSLSDKGDNNLSLALGGISTGITPLEMAGAYATIANNGEYITPTFYTKVVDSDGNNISAHYKAPYESPPHQQKP